MSKNKLKTFRTVMQVTRKEYLTPHYIRVYLTGPDWQWFENTTIGVNNKILVPPKGMNEIHFPEFDQEKMEWIQPSMEVRPAIRTYTHRGLDAKRKEIWIDFVAHGDEGPASAWAIHAQEGDVLGVMMHDGKSELYAPADWYLLAGDATAIPVLAAILEDLPSTAKGVVVIEVQGKEDEQRLTTAAGMDVHWLHRSDFQKKSPLADFVKGLSLPENDKFGYVAAEFESVKEIRSYLRKEKGWKREELYAYSYWKAGSAEDQSTGERRAEKESIH